MRRTVFFMLLIGLAGAADASPAGDRAKLQGTWRVVAIKSDGEVTHDAGGALDDDQFFRALDFRFTFDGDRLTQTGNFQGFGGPDRGAATTTFTPDPQASPKALDIREVRGRSVTTQKAIYEFSGGRLRIAFGTEARRPRSFDAKRGSHDLVYEMEPVRP